MCVISPITVATVHHRRNLTSPSRCTTLPRVQPTIAWNNSGCDRRLRCRACRRWAGCQNHPGAVGLGAAPGLLVGIQPAIWSANDEVADTEEIERNQVAINRIRVEAGSVARELSQQILIGHGLNFPWGSVNVRQRLPTIGRTALAYSAPAGLNGAFSQFVPESMCSWISPMMDWNNYP
ncbi:hypothetical protein EMIT0P43_20289 [Pseudomonas jessenii]